MILPSRGTTPSGRAITPQRLERGSTAQIDEPNNGLLTLKVAQAQFASANSTRRPTRCSRLWQLFRRRNGEVSYGIAPQMYGANAGDYATQLKALEHA